MVMFFAVIHTGLLVVLGFGGSGLEDSGIQLALTASHLYGQCSLWMTAQDLFAISRDLPKTSKPATWGNVSPVFRFLCSER